MRSRSRTRRSAFGRPGPTVARPVPPPAPAPSQDATAQGGPSAGASAGGGDRTGTRGRVYIVDADGKPKATGVVLGISDGSSTELLQGDLKEGQDVVVGLSGAAGGGRPGAPTPGGGAPRLRL